MHHIHFGDNLPILQSLPPESVDLIYIDPPFNTGKVQQRTQIKTIHSQEGDRTGFGGQRYATLKLGEQSYTDLFDDYLAFLEPRLVEARRVLKSTGTW
jgi:site-specific DNA-methyltransferase (adenine-specific)